MPNIDHLTIGHVTIVDAIHKGFLTNPELNAVMQTISQKEREEWVKQIQYELTRSAEISFSNQFGFPPITLDQVIDFYTQPDQFQLSLNKSKGRHLLFGLDHVENRRRLVNDMPTPMRLAMLKQKMRYHGIESKLSEYIIHHDRFFGHQNSRLNNASSDSSNNDQNTGSSTHSNTSPNTRYPIQIADIHDIGRAHSVYCIDIRAPFATKVVVKKESSRYTVFYNRVLTLLNWAHHFTSTYQDETGEWELSQYVAQDTLDVVLTTPEKITEPMNLCRQLAYHAALGDVLGRGDRHHENYVVVRQTLHPIDVSILFWEGNEDWITAYVEGGLYEVNGIMALSEKQANQQDTLPFNERNTLTLNKQDVSPSMWTVFSDAYEAAFASIRSKESELLAIIGDYFGMIEPSTQSKQQYVQNRLSRTYMSSQLARYEQALATYQERRELKSELDTLIHQNPKKLAQDERLKMYFYANKNRLAAFFLMPYHMTPDELKRMMRES